MSRIDNWTTDAFPLTPWLDNDTAVDTAAVIADKSTSITVVRAGSSLSPQTVRIETAGRPYQFESESGQTGQADALIIGHYGHPTITDTDLQTGDRFAVNGVGYEIVGTLSGLNNSLQAYAMVRS